MIEKTYSFYQNGKENGVYTLSNARMSVDILTYGARIIRILTPDKKGELADITVGCKTPEAYYGKNPYFGATVGRYANRIGGAKFTLNGVEYPLQANEKGNILHGGIDGDFSRKVWDAEVDGDTLILSLLSPDGESGFPGNLKVKAFFTLTDKDELVLRYEAVSDKDTVCNLTNHTYFNLAGEGTVLSHELFINAKQMTSCDRALIPDGSFIDIDGTAFSFANAKAIGRDIFADEPLLKHCNGYDFNYVIDRKTDGLCLCASVHDKTSGRKMECYTTQQGVQLYTANSTGGFVGKRVYETHCALCLETQNFPNSPNCPSFPSAILRAGECYEHTTVYRFFIEE